LNVEGNKFVKMDESLIAKAVVVLSAPPVVPLVLGLSSPLVGSVAQSLLVTSHVLATVSGAIWKSTLARDFLQLGFLKSSSSIVAQILSIA
jgi:hypothetical protein